MRRSLLAAALAASLAGCATAPRLDVAPDQVYRISDAAPDASMPPIADGRPEDDRRHRAEPLTLHVGDDHLAPAPVEAVAAELAARLRKPEQRSRLAALAAAGPLVLKRLDITIVAKDVSAGGSRQVMPGMAALDTMFKGMAQAIGGGSNVDVVVAVASGDRVFFGSAHGNLTASPSSFSISRLFGNAMDKVADGIGASEP